MRTVLITGGLGYIGSHIAVELLVNTDDRVLIIDNLSNSCEEVEQYIQTAAEHERPGCTTRRLYVDHLTIGPAGDTLEFLMNYYKVDAVIHCAGYKSVADSVQHPDWYYTNNIGSTLRLLRAMRTCGVHDLIFSSSACVYSPSQPMPLPETASTGVQSNPYGRTKRIIEDMLRDEYEVHPELKITVLRYFNPIGAHPSGYLGELYDASSKNIMPILCSVVTGDREVFTIYGTDYPTFDGTCERDYIHIMDVASAHVAALNRMTGFQVYNVGLGKATSVRELVNAFAVASGKIIPVKEEERRGGDVPVLMADPALIKTALGWKPKYTVADACRDAYRWAVMQD